MDRAKVKKKLLAGALTLLALVAGVAEAGVLHGPSTDHGWVVALWDGLGRGLGWIGQTWGRSETLPPNEEPDSGSSPDSDAQTVTPSPDSESDISPMIDPDG